MMPSRLAQITVTGKPRRFSSSSSGRRSARRARLATFTTELGLRTRLGSASSRMTGSTRVAWRIGQTSDGKWRPQSHSGRSAIDVSTLPRFHDEPPMEFTSTRERTTSGWSWASRIADAAAEGVADDDDLLLHADGPDELLQPAA